MTLVVGKTKETLQVDGNKAQSWCFKNGYRIYPVVLGNGVFQIKIENGSKQRLSDETYSTKTVYNKIWELYKMIYAKAKEKQGSSAS